MDLRGNLLDIQVHLQARSSASSRSGSRPGCLASRRPSGLASAIVKALRDGVEDVYPGDVAQEWLARWRDNPKVLERELALNGS